MPSSAITVYDYQNPRQYLLDRVAELQRCNPSLSARKLSAAMGFRSHALLTFLLQGKRPLRVKHAVPLSKGLELSSQEKLYFQALIQFDQARDPEEKKLCALWLAELHPDGVLRSRTLDEFEHVSSWLHMALLAAASLPEPATSAEALASRFGVRASVGEVRAAVERLSSLGLLTVSTDGSLRPTCQHLTTQDDVRNMGVRKYHRQALEIAIKAIEDVPLERREFQSVALTVPGEKIPLAKEMIRKFRARFEKAMSLELGSEVYHLNIQFFQLTESPRRMVCPEDDGVGTESMSVGKGARPCL